MFTNVVLDAESFEHPLVWAWARFWSTWVFFTCTIYSIHIHICITYTWYIIYIYIFFFYVEIFKSTHILWFLTLAGSPKMLLFRQFHGLVIPRHSQVCTDLAIYLHPRKLTCPLKRDYFRREYIFQPLIFRGLVSFQGSRYTVPWNWIYLYSCTCVLAYFM